MIEFKRRTSRIIIHEPIIVTKEILDLYDAYDGNFGLLSERWASNAGREKFGQFTREQVMVFSEYVDKLHLMTCMNPYMDEMRAKAVGRLAELEEIIDPGVITILRGRILGARQSAA